MTGISLKLRRFLNLVNSRDGHLVAASELVPASELSKVSVVIPCYNYASFLSQAVHSVIEQDGVETEIIIVDDASTDASLNVAYELARLHSNVIVLSHECNQGPVATFNDGLAMATGEFLVRLDADDLLTPGSLRRSVSVARAHPRVGLVYGHPLHFSGPKLPVPRTVASGWAIWAGRRWLRDRCRTGLNVITSPEVMMRTSVVDMVGGQQDLAHTHDMEMWLRMAAFTDVAYIRGADQAWHREHKHSLSATEVDDELDFVERRKAFEKLFEGVAGTKNEVYELRDLATKALARDGVRAARAELQHGQPDRRRFLAWIALTRELGLDDGTESALSRLEQMSRHNLAVWLFALVSPPERILRRAISSIRWKRWHSVGVY